MSNEHILKEVKGWLTPILLSVIAFLVVNIANDYKEDFRAFSADVKGRLYAIENAQNEISVEVTEIKGMLAAQEDKDAELEKRLAKLEEWAELTDLNVKQFYVEYGGLLDKLRE